MFRLTADERIFLIEQKNDKELNAFKEDLEYMEELPGQMCFDDFMLDDNSF